MKSRRTETRKRRCISWGQGRARIRVRACTQARNSRGCFTISVKPPKIVAKLVEKILMSY